MRKKRVVLIVAVLSSLLLSSARFAFSIPPDPLRVAQELPFIVTGSIQQVDGKAIVINGSRFIFAKSVKVVGRDGNLLRGGVQELKVGEEAEATGEGEVVFKIRLVDLAK